MNSMRMPINLPIIGCLLLAIVQFGFGQVMPPSPSAPAPSNDGVAIDQGIAYALLLVALVITYLVH
nr:Arabinogalactan protein 22, putative [Ipomoea batatas]